MKRLALMLAACVLAAMLPDGDRHAVAGVASSPAELVVPALPGSLAPRLVLSANESLLLNWLEPRNDGYALQYSRWGPGGWQIPTTVARGDNWFVNWADFPSVVPITRDFWLAHWLVRRPAGGYAYDVHIARSNDGGRSWHEGMPLHRDNTDTEHGFVTIYPHDGAAGVVWLDGRKTINPNGGMTLRGATVMPDGRITNKHEIDSLICDCCQTDAVVASTGPVVAYRDRTANETRDIFVARNVEERWLPGKPVADDGWVIAGCPVNGPALARSGTDIGVAWFTAADDVPKVRLALSDQQAERFGAAVDIVVGDSLGRVGLVLLPDGSAVVSSISTEKGKPARLELVRVDTDGQLHKPYVVADDVYTFSVPQLKQHGDDLVTVWTTKTDDKTYLRSARIPLIEIGDAPVE